MTVTLISRLSIVPLTTVKQLFDKEGNVTGSEEVTLYTTGNGYDYYTYTISSGVTP